MLASHEIQQMSYTNKGDLNRLKFHLLAEKDIVRKTQILRRAHKAKLMLGQGFFFRLAVMIRGIDHVLNFTAMHMPSEIEQMWEAMLQHMAHGTDRYDSKSAGGWCRDEFEAFKAIVITQYQYFG